MKNFTTLIFLVFTSILLNAQNNESTILEVLTNTKWEGTGMLMGKKATFAMDWQSVLNNQFIKLDFQNKRKSSDSKDIIFKATAFYKIVDGTKIIGNWFDNRGVTLPLKGSVNNNSLIIFWGNDESEKGKTIYSHTDNNEIYVEDFIFNNGEYIKFGYATYK